MIRRPPRSPLFPSPPLSRSVEVEDGDRHPGAVALGAPPLPLEGVEESPAVEETGQAVGRAEPHQLELGAAAAEGSTEDRKSTRLESSHSQISYAGFCFEKKN